MLRMIARLPPYSYISDYMINELHWLPFLARVRYKVLLLVAKSQQGLAPRYLCELMAKPLSARSSCPLRSADRCDLLMQWSRRGDLESAPMILFYFFYDLLQFFTFLNFFLVCLKTQFYCQSNT